MSSPRQEDQRPRSRTMLSFTSNHSTKSHRSSGSMGKIDLTETSKEKRHLNTKADPTLAINEAQPSAVALELSNLDNLRAIQHKDAQGNIISDPDRSNPTRHRMERPLDTIRSFEAAAEGRYKRRANSSQQRPSSGHGLNGPLDSRRSSGFFGHNQQNNQSRGNQDGGYYGNRNNMIRPDSFIDAYTGQNPPIQAQGRGPRAVHPRMNSEPMLSGGRIQQNVYPSHSYQQSHDTVNSAGSGSYQTDPYGNSTDPSSENSSLDRIHQFPKQSDQQQSENHGFTGPAGNQYQHDNVGNSQGSYGRNGSGQPGPSGQQRYDSSYERPTPPPKEAPRVPIKLDSHPGSSPLARQVSETPTEKRKSWFKRRFSKN